MRLRGAGHFRGSSETWRDRAKSQSVALASTFGCWSLVVLGFVACFLVFVMSKTSQDLPTSLSSQDEQKSAPSFVEFLATSKRTLVGLQQTASSAMTATPATFHLVMGNEACDADSTIAALTLAYAASLRARSNDVWVPLVAIPKADLRLRGEVPYMLRRAGISSYESLLLFMDEIDLKLLATGAEEHKFRLAITLVDHNKLSQQLSFLAPFVEEIVDHHKDEGLYLSSTTGRRTIEVVGSACSLVAEYIHTHTPQLLQPTNSHTSTPTTVSVGSEAKTTVISSTAQDSMGDVASVPVPFLLACVVLLDTHNMSIAVKKGTPKDQAALDVLLAALQLPSAGAAANSIATDQGAALFRELLFRRSDTSSLSTRDILRKDMKVATSASGRVSVSISGAPMELTQWLQKDAALVAHCAEFAVREGFSAALVMTVFTDPDTKSFGRQVLIVVPEVAAADASSSSPEAEAEAEARSKTLEQSLRRTLEQSAVLKLQKMDAWPSQEQRGARVAAYTQLQVTSSRKQLMPLVQELLSKL